MKKYSHVRRVVCDKCIQPDDTGRTESPMDMFACSRCLKTLPGGMNHVDENPRLALVCHLCLRPEHRVLCDNTPYKTGRKHTDCDECGNPKFTDKIYLVRLPTGMEIMARAVEER